MTATPMDKSLDQQADYFANGHTLDLKARRNHLIKLKQVIRRYESEITEALKKDLGKSTYESYGTEIGYVIEDINHILKNLKKWGAPKSVSSSLLVPLSQAKVYREPLGHVLVVAPWNYPFMLTLAPAASALAAGNVVTLKPSELAPATAEVMNKMIRDNFPEGLIQVHTGGVEVSQKLLERKFDHIFFTGSPRVGQIVMEAASKHLTPVTLELGGKTPCIIDKTANLEVAARRIVWGKTVNAGQTCVAPDYLLIHKDIKTEFLEKLTATLENFLGPEAEHSPDYGRIVNKSHFDRLVKYMNDGEVIYGGRFIETELFIEPTILDNVPQDSPAMKEEIFGPILPIVTYSTDRELIETVEKHRNPLALYIFSENESLIKQVLREVPFGGGCVNDTLMHLAAAELPFGGRGTSGMGAYHGEKGFLTFSHEKSVMRVPTWLDPSLRYPPYGEGKLKVVKMLLGRG